MLGQLAEGNVKPLLRWQTRHAGDTLWGWTHCAEHEIGSWLQ
jgi:hypothetical protein